MRRITQLIVVISFSVLMGLAGFAALRPESAKADSLPTLSPDSTPTNTITDTHHTPIEGVDYIVIEQDIQVPPDYYVRKALGPAAAWKPSLWTNGQIPYEYDANVTPVSRTLMLNAMNEWQGVANVQFNPCASNACGSGNYLHIQHSTGNNSAVGMIGGQQTVNIVSWNTHYIIVHELGHALGYWHEQSRTDRDLFVTINSANIQPGQASQFQIEPNQVRYGPYDFDSVMHYDQCAFSIACPIGKTCACGITTTITVKPPNEAWQTLIGQRTHLSYLDKTTMSFLYTYPNWVFVDAAYGGTPQGTFGSPYTSVLAGYAATPDNGTLIVQPGNYGAVNTYNRPMTIRAPLGNVTLGQ